PSITEAGHPLHAVSESDIYMHYILHVRRSVHAAAATPASLYVPINTTSGLQAYQKRWVGFPELSHVQCTPLFRKSTRNHQDCPQFLEKYGFNRYTPVTDEEIQFPLAYIILFHKDLHQVLFLLRAIYRRHNVYCLTVDLDTGPAFINAVRSVALESIVYAGFSRFLADINCMQDLIAHPVGWKYLHNLPGQQFPLRLSNILKIYNGCQRHPWVPGRRSHYPRRYKKQAS
ncbi:unnamed protein product, partial [Candidula unifasciata]